MLDSFFSLFLAPINIYTLSFILLVSCFVDFEKTCQLVFLILITLILNPYLKFIWKVPLPPALGKEGWAFPSGHMQMACTFYGWMAWQTSYRWLRLIILCLLGAVGFGLIYFGFHDLKNVLGAVFFAGLILIIYHKILTIPWMKHRFFWMGLWATPLTLPLIMAVSPSPYTKLMLWAQGGLIVFSLGGLVGKRFLKSYYPQS